MTAIPNHSINYFAPLAQGGTCSVGQVMIKSFNGDYYVVSSISNRGTRGSEGVALTAWNGGAGTTGQVKIANTGILPASISGLSSGYGSRTLVRCSDAGAIERVASYTAGDDIIGYAEEDGRVHLHFGLPWAAIASAAGVLPASPNSSVQYNNGGSAFGGASNVSIASGNLCVGAATDTLPSIGDIRVKRGTLYGTGFRMSLREATTTASLGILSTYQENDLGGGPLSYTPNALYIGTDASQYGSGGLGFDYSAFTTTSVFASRQVTWQLSNQETYVGGSPQFMWLTQIGVSGDPDDDHCVCYISRYTNLALAGARGTSLVSSDLGGGRSCFFFGEATTEPTTGPAADGVTVWNKPSNNHLHYIQPSNNIVPLWDGPQITNSSTGTLNDVTTLDSDSVPARVIRFTGTGASITLTSLSGGRAGRSVFIIYDAEDGFTIQHDSGGTTANRIICPDDGNYVMDFGSADTKCVELVYDTTASRWIMQATSQRHLGRTGQSSTITCDTLSFNTDSGGYVRFQENGTPTAYVDASGMSLLVPLGGNSGATPSSFRVKRASITYASANYTLSASEYACPFLTLGGTTGGARDLVCPNTAGSVYNIKNNTADTITVKINGGTGATLASGASGWFIHNGSDYEAR